MKKIHLLVAGVVFLSLMMIGFMIYQVKQTRHQAYLTKRYTVLTPQKLRELEFNSHLPPNKIIAIESYEIASTDSHLSGEVRRITLGNLHYSRQTQYFEDIPKAGKAEIIRVRTTYYHDKFNPKWPVLSGYK